MESGILSGVPNFQLLKSLSEAYGVNLLELSTAYDAYLRNSRADFKNSHASFLEILGFVFTSQVHPLKYYRSQVGLSQVGFCKGLCIHPGPVANFERNQQRGIPAGLIKACDEIGWSYRPLETAVAQWRANGYADRTFLSA